METREICRGVDFLMNPQKFIEGLVGLVLASKSNFMIWIDQHRIYIGNPDYFWNNWGLIFNINPNNYFKEYIDNIIFQKKTNIGKYFFYPIWIEVFEKSEQISIVQIRKTGLCGKMIKISRLTPEVFLNLLGDFAKKPPKKIGDCYCEGILPEISEKDRPRLLEAMSTLGFKPNGFTRKTPVWMIEAGK